MGGGVRACFPNLLRLSFHLKGCGLWIPSRDFVTHNYETLKWLSSLSTLMQKSLSTFFGLVLIPCFYTYNINSHGRPDFFFFFFTTFCLFVLITEAFVILQVWKTLNRVN